MREFEFIRKNGKNIFFVAHRHKKTNPFGLVFLCVWAFGGRIRKAALGKCPVDTRNCRCSPHQYAVVRRPSQPPEKK